MNNPKLVGCNPALEPLVTKLLVAMAALGFPMVVTDGLRTVAQQQALYAQGRTAPGLIVTKNDGILKPSNHQSGKAADCTFVVAGKPSWDNRLPWRAYGACAEALNLRWGGRFPSFDGPHVELP